MTKDQNARMAYASLLSAENSLKLAGQSAGNEVYDKVISAIRTLNEEIARGAYLPALTSFPFALLNVGCAASERAQYPRALDWQYVRHACQLLGFHPELIADRIGATERTLVIRLQTLSGVELTQTDIANLSAQLGQDCIAAQPQNLAGNPVTSGFLAGPFAAEWGDFNPAYFLTQ